MILCQNLLPSTKHVSISVQCNLHKWIFVQPRVNCFSNQLSFICHISELKQYHVSNIYYTSSKNWHKYSFCIVYHIEKWLMSLFHSTRIARGYFLVYTNFCSVRHHDIEKIMSICRVIWGIFLSYNSLSFWKMFGWEFRIGMVYASS